MRALIPAVLLLLASGCASRRTVAVDSTAERRATVALARRDSLVGVAVAALDSPEIVVEWLDTPRRRLTLRARRIRAAGSAAAAVSVDSAAACAESGTVSAESESRRSAPLSGWWVVGAGAAVMIVLSLIRRCARR